VVWQKFSLLLLFGLLGTQLFPSLATAASENGDSASQTVSPPAASASVAAFATTSSLSPLYEIQRLVNANELDQALAECQKFFALNPPEANAPALPFFKYALKQRLFQWQKHLATGIEQEKDCVQLDENLDTLFKMLSSEEIQTLRGADWSREDLGKGMGELLDLLPTTSSNA
jgi:hypothetical protein